MKCYLKQNSFKAMAAFLFLLGCVLISSGPLKAEENLLLFDGETPFTYEYGVPNTTDAFKGTTCFEGHPDSWHTPSINLNAPAYRKDISGFDEIWFFAKSSVAGKTFDFSISGWPYLSNKVRISSYIQGGSLSTSYKLVRIPIAALKTVEYTLSTIERLYFGLANPPDHYLYIDEAWAVKLSNVDPARLPILTGAVTQEFGSVNLGQEQSKTVTLKNIGTGPLSVGSITITGANAGEFSASVNSFTINAGSSYSFTISFKPTNTEVRQASLVLNHPTTKTLSGSTTAMPLQGTGLGAFVTPIDNALDFGKVAAGKPATLALRLKNTGNQALTISSITPLNPQFSVAPQTLSIPAYGNSSTQVTFNPTATGKIYSALSITSNDPMKSEVNIDLIAEGITQATGILPLAVKVDNVTSSTIELSFAKAQGQDAVKVYIAPEPAVLPQPLPDEMLVATLPATATNYTITKVAASCDVFIRVEALKTGTPIATGYAYAKTVGGPRAQLDTPLQEVHMVAPNILMMVFLDKKVTSYSDGADPYNYSRIVGYTGPQWQAGPWAVDNNGQNIGVGSVYRNSLAAGQLYYEVGYAKPTHDDLLDVAHCIYLVLNQTIGNRKMLHITGPFNTDVYLPFSDYYMETPVIQVNQVGYSPRATKRYAYVSWWLGDGGPLSLAEGKFPQTAEVISQAENPLALPNTESGQLTLTARIIEGSLIDPDAATEVKEIDISNGKLSRPVNQDAVYRVRVPGVGVSWPTRISEKAVFETFYTIARGLYHNRWGRDLKPQYTDWSTRPPDHPIVYTAEKDTTGFFDPATPQTGERPFSGGHHDAADFDQSHAHYIVAMLLMRAFEANKDAFADNQLSIPESGNNIPDILDEALYELKGWQQLQEEDGGIRPGVESWRHPWGIYFADGDPLPFWTYSRNLVHTIRMAGLFAQAARLVMPYDIDKARELRDAAIKAYNYSLANEMGPQHLANAFLATSELMRLRDVLPAPGDTNDYKGLFESIWTTYQYDEAWRLPIFMRQLVPSSGMYFSDSGCLLADNIIDYIKVSNANPAHVATIQSKIKNGEFNANTCATRLETYHAHRNGRIPGFSPTWGMGSAVGQYIRGNYLMYLFDDISPEKRQEYLDGISLSADYILGCNPMGMAWVTGLGSRHPENACHNDGQAFDKTGQGQIPGIPVYGPTKGIPGVAHYFYQENVFYPAIGEENQAYPPMRRYMDTWASITNNEFTVQETMAPDTELFAMLIAQGMSPSKDLLPRKAGFLADVRSGAKPLSVHFNDNSNGPIEAWEWSFGDGSVSEEKNPVHTYTRDGSYTVSLKVTCNGGTSEEVKSGYITVGGNGIIYGDVSGDGVITAFDAALAAMLAVGIDVTPYLNGYPLASARQAADFDSSGLIDAYDAALIARRAVGL